MDEDAIIPLWSEPLSLIDPSDPTRFVDQSIHQLFAQLRCEQPIHYCSDSPNGPFWSILRFSDIAEMEADTRRFSSRNGFTFADLADDFKYRSILSSDGQEHLKKRRSIAPLMSLDGVHALEWTIQKAVTDILDAIPLGAPFDWVNLVSKRLTGRMLATMMGAPQSEYERLIYWTEIAAIIPGPQEAVKTFEEKDCLLQDCYAYFIALREDFKEQKRAMNFISILAHSQDQRDMTDEEFLLFVIILLVGGNETTRNSISGSLLFLDQNPSQRHIMYTVPETIKSAVSEIIRFQTPLSYMRRTATEDVEWRDKLIRKGDKVIFWYASGNRDPLAIDDPDRFIVNRRYAGRHLSFGFGPHRCIGRHLAEMQIRILWEEIIRRGWTIRPCGEVKRTQSNFINGFEKIEAIING